MHYVYILRCSDSSLYVGMTSDLDVRLLRHNEGVACSYTAKRRPVQLVHAEEFPSAEAARDRERQLKRWTANKKEALIAGNLKALKRFSRCRNP